MQNVKKWVIVVLSALVFTVGVNAAESMDSKKLTVVITTDQLKTAGFGLTVANIMQKGGVESTVFLAADAMPLALKKGYQPKFGGGASPREMILSLLKQGGKVYVCEGFVKMGEVTEKDMVEGVKVVGPEMLGAGIFGSTKLLTF